MTKPNTKKGPSYENDVQVKNIIKSGGTLMERAEALEIVDVNTKKDAAELLGDIKQHKKIIKERRDYYVKPQNEILTGIRNYYKKIEEPFNDAERNVRIKITQYQNKIEEDQRKAEEKARKKQEKAVEQGKPVPVVNTPIAPKAVKSEGAAVSFRDNWKASVTNEQEFYKWVFEQQMFNLIKPDDSAINQFAKTIKDTRTIPGLMIRNERVSSVRTG